MNLNLVYRNVLGKVAGTAIARDVRLTPTLYVVEPGMVQVLTGKVQFGGERRYRRDTLQQHPKTHPHSGNGRWYIASVAAPAQPVAVPAGGGFRDPMLRKAFDEAVAAYQTRSTALFDAAGAEARTNSAATMFWRGFHGDQMPNDGTFGYAYWKAGRAMGRVAGGAS